MTLYRAPPRWTPEEIDRLRFLLDRQLTYSEIGERMGRSKNSVLAKMDRLRRGLDGPTPPPPPPPVDRDPCPRCQARGDLGCAHRAPGTARMRLSSR